MNRVSVARRIALNQPTTAPPRHATPRRHIGGPCIVLALLALLSCGAAAEALESLYLVRHAEKQEPWPAELSVYQPLTEEGRQRAEHWASQLRGKHLAAIYSSPYGRTVQTAVAISTALKIPLHTDATTTEPDQIADFVARLRTEHAESHAVLIVGHSDTLPMFLRHFGADSACEERLTLHRSGRHELIKGYSGLFHVDLTKEGCDALDRQNVELPDPGDQEAALEPRPVALDPAQLVASSQQYRVIYGHESMGVAELSLVPGEAGLEARFSTNIGRAGIQQEAVIVLDTDGANHQKVSIHGPMGPSEADVEIRFEDGKAIGHTDFPRARQKPQGKLPVDRSIPAGTFERNSLFTLLPAMPIDRVAAFSLYAYDAREDLLQPIDLRVTGPRVDPTKFAGAEAYRVEISGMEQGFVVWIHAETPRHVLGIDWIGQPWTYELLPGKP